jgi:hypothetical protein
VLEQEPKAKAVREKVLVLRRRPSRTRRSSFQDTNLSRNSVSTVTASRQIVVGRAPAPER